VRDLHTIVTPENVSFEFELAGVASRAAAWAIDALVMGALITTALLFASALGVLLGGTAFALYFVLAFLIQWGYGALSEWRFAGQTVGKRVLGISVLQANGTRMTLMQAVLRNLVRTADILPALYLTGGLCALLDRDGRRLGDLAAGTVVVRRRRSPRPSALAAKVDRYNSFVNDPMVVHASTRITPRERDAMVGLAMRREALPLVVRYALFGKLAQHLEARLGVKRPDYFSEERYVLNLTAVVLGLSPAHADPLRAPAPPA
jgi:uncharacterized RDD family membrane protein YckC